MKQPQDDQDINNRYFEVEILVVLGSCPTRKTFYQDPISPLSTAVSFASEQSEVESFETLRVKISLNIYQYVQAYLCNANLRRTSTCRVEVARSFSVGAKEKERKKVKSWWEMEIFLFCFT